MALPTLQEQMEWDAENIHFGEDSSVVPVEVDGVVVKAIVRDLVSAETGEWAQHEARREFSCLASALLPAPMSGDFVEIEGHYWEVEHSSTIDGSLKLVLKRPLR